jgi:hypothetical protein
LVDSPRYSPLELAEDRRFEGSTCQRVTKDPGSRAAAVAMAFKLIESASSSNDLTNQRVVISKPRDTPILSPIALLARRRRVKSPGDAYPQPLTREFHLGCADV